MTVPIRIPVEAPGSQESANDLDRVANSTRQIVRQQRELIVSEEKLTTATTAANARLRENAKAHDAVRDSIIKQRQEASIRSTVANEMSSEGGLNRSGQRRLLNFLPGGRFLGAGAQLADSGASSGIIAGLGALAAVAVGAAFAIKAHNVAIERDNKALEDNIKTVLELGKANKDIVEQMQSRATSGFRSIRGSAGFLLRREGEFAQNTVSSALNAGGPEALNTLVSLFKNNRWLQRSQLDSMEVLDKAKGIGTRTGADINEVLKEFAKAQGAINFRGVERTFAGGTGKPETDEQFMLRMKGNESPLGQLIAKFDRQEEAIRGANAATMTSPALIMAGINQQLQDLIDPMAKVIKAHNDALNEQIVSLNLVSQSQKSYADFWLEHLGPLKFYMDKLGIESTQAGATRQIDALKNQTITVPSGGR